MAGLDAERVRAAIAELPPDQRAVLLLRIIGDLTIEQIAEAVGKRPGAVKALQRRALGVWRGRTPFRRFSDRRGMSMKTKTLTAVSIAALAVPGAALAEGKRQGPRRSPQTKSSHAKGPKAKAFTSRASTPRT